MERIYSRKRLKIKLAICLILLGLLLFFIEFLITMYPIFEQACKSKAESLGADITSKEVNRIMSNYHYDDLVYMERGNSGEITLIKTKIIPINQIISEVVLNIKNSIDSIEEVSVQVNLGKVTGIAFLSKMGTQFNMKLESSRRSGSKSCFRIC